MGLISRVVFFCTRAFSDNVSIKMRVAYPCYKNTHASYKKLFLSFVKQHDLYRPDLHLFPKVFFLICNYL